MNEWYRRPGNAERMRGFARRYRSQNIELVQEKDRARGFREYDRQKIRARAAANHAIERGELVRQPCEVCGAVPTDGHHDDYSKPLEVRWLCHEHHGAEHRTFA